MAGVVHHLIALHMGVYSDSLIETLIALLWQYSLVMLQVQSIQAQLNNNDSDTDLNSFHPHGSALHYRDPVVCNEMLQIVSELVMQKVVSF
jgi:hypothetical protein